MQFLRFASLTNVPGLRHAVTTRGGTGHGPYDALNLAYHVGDDPARVTENRLRLAKELGYDAASLVAAQQPHKWRASFVGKHYVGRGAFDWDSALPHSDAMILQMSQVPVLVQVADCAPLLIVDEEKHTLAVVHAGWRGAVEGIASEVVSRMWMTFGAREERLKVGIGPCLCTDCFEIGEEVAEAERVVVLDAVVRRDEWDKPHLDLRLLLRRDLEAFGVSPQNIEVMPHCPRCMNDLFFSHRAQGGTAGRFGLVAWWQL